MVFIAFAAWLVGVGVSYFYGNRALPTVILLLGIAATAVQHTIGIGFFYVAAMALLGAIIWIANRFDMS